MFFLLLEKVFLYWDFYIFADDLNELNVKISTMKNYGIIRNVTMLVCILAMGMFSACSSDDDTDDGYENIVKNIKDTFYDGKGEIKANKLSTYETGEYNLIADEEKDVRAFYTELTGVDTPAKSEYEYTYKSRDGKGVITLKGTQVAKDGIFATIYLAIPECPEIKIVHIGTDAIMGDNNSEDQLPGTSDGYTYRIKSYN